MNIEAKGTVFLNLDLSMYKKEIFQKHNDFTVYLYKKTNNKKQ